MEVLVALSKKTTILLSPRLHARLKELASVRDTSIGELIRRAVIAQYGLVGSERRLKAARALASLALPVSDPKAMKEESVVEVSSGSEQG